MLKLRRWSFKRVCFTYAEERKSKIGSTGVVEVIVVKRMLCAIDEIAMGRNGCFLANQTPCATRTRIGQLLLVRRLS